MSGMIEGKQVVHDFADGEWGHAIITWTPSADLKSANVYGVGVGIEVGHVIKGREGTPEKYKDVYFLVEEIKYGTNPPDSFNAVLVMAQWVDP